MKVKKKWICNDVISYEGHFEGYFCPKCGKGFLDDLCENNGADRIDAYDEFDYCPFCGADVRPDNAPLADDDSIYG